ncbi:MAG: DUF2605 domain-containing protein [Geitlerinemataceae cyanobacterium]
MVNNLAEIQADRCMSNPEIPDPKLIEAILGPLLEDFVYWFARSQKLLENEKILFLGEQGQADLLARVSQAQQEVSATQMLTKTLGGQAGVEMSVLLPWHKLLAECSSVAMRFRSEQSVASPPPEVN